VHHLHRRERLRSSAHREPSLKRLRQSSSGARTISADRSARRPGAQGRPKFLIIVADDLGFSDIGAFGGEIELKTNG
jgi:hypothetical protein